MLTLETPITAIPRYGKLFAKRLLKLKIATVRDLLLYFPFRYDDLSNVVPIVEARVGARVTVRGTITAIANRRSFRRRMFVTEALLRDESGTMRVVWFNQAFLTRVLTPHTEVWLSGKVVQDSYGTHLASPVYERVEKESLHTGRIVPIYSVAPPITQKQLRVLMKLALPSAVFFTDDLPTAIVKQRRLLSLSQAMQTIHFPENSKALERAIRRMAFAEFFRLQCHILSTRAAVSREQAPAIRFFEKETKAFVASLPFTLTEDQRKAAWEIIGDIQKATPARRLLNGDVGSGKTVVAVIVALNIVLSGKRVFFMVPTAILAEQHARTLTELFKHTTVHVALCTASYKITKKESARADIVIGTHALLHRKGMIKNVGLVIIDEQHRFGVQQRSVLVKESDSLVPHLLTMTATPIPRTLAQTPYGDFDISFLCMMPKGRKSIMTRFVTHDKRQAAYEFMRKEIQNGRQVFVVCPLIDPSDTLGVRAATDVYEHLRKEIFPEHTVGILHGRVKADAREKTMRAFSENTINILVATSVVEVGIDIANATIMMIEGAERFGLAQLHQLRGRVGRGSEQSYCFLFTDTDGEAARARLQAVVRLQDGFALAEADLQLRGPGEMFGVAQSGYSDFRFARWNDLALMKETKEAASEWFEEVGRSLTSGVDTAVIS
ncbi:ATP-dependent DNA helicase RecG [Candidatus Uhrbacteria bacterium]|nr:ATP-dependent DNA helicase RecG [Candidatus Uhrbacteria bacterium]